MQVFLSYASADRQLAEEATLALRGAGYDVFFDRESLSPATEYHEAIQTAINDCRIFVFLVSNDSVSSGGYALSELAFAQMKWPSPDGYVLPVIVRPIDLKEIPTYLRAVTILKPKGNIAAEILAAVRKLAWRSQRAKFARVGYHIASAIAGAALAIGTMAVIRHNGYSTPAPSDVPDRAASAPSDANEFAPAAITADLVRTIVLRGEWADRYKLSKTYKILEDGRRKVIVDQLIDLLQASSEREAMAAARFLVGHLWFHDLASGDALRVATAFPERIHPNSDVRATVASIFHMSYKAEVIPSIFGIVKRLCHDSDSKVRAVALQNIKNLLYQSPQYIEDEIWTILVSAWRSERDPNVRAAALSSFKEFTYSERLKDRAPTMSAAIAEALRDGNPALARASLWILGGGDWMSPRLQPTKEYEGRIFESVLALYKHDRSIPQSWYVGAFKTLRGRLPSWASEQLSRDQLQVAREEESRRESISRMAADERARKAAKSAKEQGASASKR